MQITDSSHALVANAIAAELNLRYAIQGLSPIEQRRLIAFGTAVARHESGYGTWWSNSRVYNWLKNHDYILSVDFDMWEKAVDSCGNFGAIQYVNPAWYARLEKIRPWPLLTEDGQGVLYHDTKPIEGRGNIPYPIYLRKYPTLEESVRGLVKEVYVNRPSVFSAALTGSYWNFSATMRATTYYEGRGDTREEQIKGHVSAIYGHLVKICRALGWDMPGGEKVSPPMVRLFDNNKHVKTAEERLLHHGFFAGNTPNTYFDSTTKQAVVAFQSAVVQAGVKISVDGIVGEKETWPLLLKDVVPGVTLDSTTPSPAPSRPAQPPPADFEALAAVNEAEERIKATLKAEFDSLRRLHESQS